MNFIFSMLIMIPTICMVIYWFIKPFKYKMNISKKKITLDEIGNSFIGKRLKTYNKNLLTLYTETNKK